jgi:hypothetical protein
MESFCNDKNCPYNGEYKGVYFPSCHFVSEHEDYAAQVGEDNKSDESKTE